jgi:hypothetical protein
MSIRNERFFGAGNYVVGDNKPAWQIKCRACNNMAVIILAGKSLPPEVVVKEFRKRQWIVGLTDEEDTCPECRELDIATDPANNPDTREYGGRVESFQAKLKLDEFRTRVVEQSKLIEEQAVKIAELCNELVAHRNLLLRLHRAIINDSALTMIEQAFPTLPWVKRIAKKQGSAVPRKQPERPDAGFEKWINELESKRRPV